MRGAVCWRPEGARSDGVQTGEAARRGERALRAGTRNWNVLFQPESEECKLYNLEGNKGDGGSYLEAWSFTTQWQATTQIEMHRMRIYESYRLLYDLKLEEALAKITELVETGIEYGSEVTWADVMADIGRGHKLLCRMDRKV